MRNKVFCLVAAVGIITACTAFSCEEDTPILPEEEKPVQVTETVVATAPEVITTDYQVISKFYYDIPLDCDLQDYICETCEEYGIDPAVVIAMIERESTFQADAIGDNGNAYGLLQVWPKWHSERMARLSATDLLNPYQNIRVAVDYLGELMTADKGIEWAVQAYNAGANGARKGYGAEYAAEVMARSEELKEGVMEVRFYSDDLDRDIARYLDYQDQMLERRPVCSECDEHIQDEQAYYKDGKYICLRCMENYLVSVEE